MKYTLYSQIVEANGKTVRENNMTIGHNIPIGTLVEFQASDWWGGGACRKYTARMWVIEHGRDCDGTPLYVVASVPPDEYENSIWIESLRPLFHHRVHGLSEKYLTPIEVTPELIRGEGALDWED